MHIVNFKNQKSVHPPRWLESDLEGFMSKESSSQKKYNKMRYFWGFLMLFIMIIITVILLDIRCNLHILSSTTEVLPSVIDCVSSPQ